MHPLVKKSEQTVAAAPCHQNLHGNAANPDSSWITEWLPGRSNPSLVEHSLLQGDCCHISLPTQPSIVSAVCDFVLELCCKLLSDEHAVNVRTALSEALTNAMVHGNLEIDSCGDWAELSELVQRRLKNPDLARRTVMLEIALQNKTLSFAVEDEGGGFILATSESLKPQDIVLNESGRGIMMIQHLMDTVSWNKRRNRIVMAKVID